MTADSTRAPERTPVVAIGASAGGLESLEAFFQRIPANSGMAFVVIQHLSPDFESFMPQILERQLELSVRSAEDGMPLEPDSVYLLPPKKNMAVKDNVLSLEDIAHRRGLNKPIDHFFETLAADSGRYAVGIVLSGTGSDGSLGIVAIHDHGGTVMVESPESARFDGMPRAAIQTRTPNVVGTPSELAQELLLMDFEAPDAQRLPSANAKRGLHADDRILNLLRTQRGVDFSAYKETTVHRRIDKLMRLDGFSTMDDYITQLESDPSHVDRLYAELLIGVTQFFRDPAAFAKLRNDVIPAILGSKGPNEPVRVWLAGCSSGEEVYSLTMLFIDAIDEISPGRDLEVFATDIDDEALEHAKRGIYSQDQLETVPADFRSNYFKRLPIDGSGKTMYQVLTRLRRHIVFARHNVFADPPFTRMDLVCCRNLLIYLTDETQDRIQQIIYFSLNAGGYLFLGPSESLGRFLVGYDIVDRHWRLFRKLMREPAGGIRGPKGIALGTTSRTHRVSSVRTSPTYIQEQRRNAVVSRGQELLLQQFVPASLLLDEQLELLHVYGDAGQWLTPRPGAPGLNLRTMMGHRLVTSLTIAMGRAERDQAAVRYRHALQDPDVPDGAVDLVVRPFQAPVTTDESASMYLVSFHEPGHDPVMPEPVEVGTQASMDQIARLEQELRDTRLNLQSTIEQLETANEELQSTNEELLASNEELQSTNEELHSVNEELYTVNAEFQRKLHEVTELTQDEANLLKATDIGVAFLDADLRIRKFAPKAGEYFNLLESDIDRPIHHIRSNLLPEDLPERVERVIATGQSEEVDVVLRQDNAYILRILPFVTEAGETNGVVLNMVDVSRLHRVEAELRKRIDEVNEQRDHLDNLNEVLADGYWDWHIDKDYEYMSPRFWEMFGIDPATKPHHPSAWREHIFPTDLKRVMKTFQAHVDRREEEPFRDQVRYKHADGSTVWVEVRGKVVEWNEDGSPKRAVGSHTNITELKAAIESYKLVTEGASVGIWDWDIPSGAENWSARFYELLGFDVGEIEPSVEAFADLLHPADQEATVALVDRHFKGEADFDIEYRLQTKNGDYRWFRGSGKALIDNEGNPQRMVGSIQDIHEQRLYRQRLESSNADLKQFAYAASHDLRTPLRHIGSFSQLLSRGLEGKLHDSNLESALHYITEGVSRMDVLINGVMQVAQLDALALELEPVDIGELVQRLATEQGFEEGVTIVGHEIVQADRSNLSRLVQNLLGNAQRYAREGVPPKVEITLERMEGSVAIRFQDNGVGIPKVSRENVFRIFNRLNPDIPGSGIGLAVCRKVAALHGGSIKIVDGAPEGTCFELELPA